MLEKAKEKLNNSRVEANDWKSFMNGLNSRKMVMTPWCGNEDCEE